MNKPLVDYVNIPSFEEYKQWFKDHFELERKDGILLVTMKTGDGPMYWSGMAHRAMSQLTRIISMDHDNEILIWTHKGPHWMQSSDPHGWQRYAEERFDHQYFDDPNLIKNMIFDLEIPTIGAQQGSGFHWDSAILCDITIASEDCRWDDPHLTLGLVPGDGMAMLMQHFLGTKRGNYMMYTSRQWDTKHALEWGWINEICPKDKVLERAWELAYLIKSVPRETRTITAQLCKRPLERLLVNDLKLHTVSEQYATMIKVAQNQVGLGKEQHDEKDVTSITKWRYSEDNQELLTPPTVDTWINMKKKFKAD